LSRPRVTLVVIALLASAYGWLVQPSGDNQKANYALTRALAGGTAAIDGPIAEGAATIDVVEHDGRHYAAKPPGLAALSVPAYLALDAVGVRVTGDPIRPMWALHLWSVVLPAALLLLLVARVGDRVEPGMGLPAAVILGVSTLVLPFATLFFVHVPAALFGFAAFALLWRERDGPSRPLWLAAAGALVGLAATVDYPVGMLAPVLGAYAIARTPRATRALAYVAGVVVGILPIFAYNWWAFGSPLHFPYDGWAAPGEDPRGGFFGASAPSLTVLLIIVFVPAGIAVLAPAVPALVSMFGRGLRAEALTIAAGAAVFLLHNSASTENPFGGASPGPRHLIPALPFLAVPVALALRRWPGATIGLALGGAVVMVVATTTTPLAAWDGRSWSRFADGEFVPTVGDELGLDGWVAMAPFFVFLAAAAAFAVRAAWRGRVPPREVVAGGLALGAWWLVARYTDELVLDRGLAGRLALLACVGVAAAAVVLVYRSVRGRGAAVPAS
jgi:4-amino-4-deoxy-L-arabinose transferase-like glycosyltransferase